MCATIRTSPEPASVTTHVTSPAASNFGVSTAPSSSSRAVPAGGKSKCSGISVPRSRPAGTLAALGRCLYNCGMLNEVYNKRIIELAGNIPRIGRLPAPDATATAHSRLCGSTVTVDLKMDGDTVTDFAHEVKACALGQASSSI